MTIGGILMCMNLYRLGKKCETLGLALFILAYAFVGSALVNWAIAAMGLNVVWGALFLNLSAALIYVLWVWPRYIGNTAFRNRSILGPVVVCMLLFWSAQKITPYLLQHQPKEIRQQFENMMPK